MKEYRITYRSEIYVKADSIEDAKSLVDNINLDPKIGDNAERVTDYCFVEYVSIENSDGTEYEELN